MQVAKIGVAVTLLAFSVVTASFISLVVDERQSQCKHMQMLAGLTPLRYWIGNFLFDWVRLAVFEIIPTRGSCASWFQRRSRLSYSYRSA